MRLHRLSVDIAAVSRRLVIPVRCVCVCACVARPYDCTYKQSVCVLKIKLSQCVCETM
jgi:hypothetical protein